MAQEYQLILHTKDDDGSHYKKVSFKGHVTAIRNILNPRVEVNEDHAAVNGETVKAIADKESITITLDSTLKDGESLRDIDMKIDSTKYNVIVKSLSGVKVNGLDEVVFSGTREKASFEYDSVKDHWILW